MTTSLFTHSNPIQTQYLILRKTPFQESSYVVSGFSPEYGRLDFLIKGARSMSKKKFPIIDLYRKYRIFFRPPKSNASITYLISIELIETYDHIALSVPCFCAVAYLASSLLKFVQPMTSVQNEWKAFSLALKRMNSTKEPQPFLTLAKLVFLKEQGIFPNFSSQMDDIIHQLYLYALNENITFPTISQSIKIELFNFISNVAEKSELFPLKKQFDL